MRIISGTAGSVPLRVPRSLTRPTTDRVREAVFSSLSEIIPGSRVLDLFAGSGSLGLEALSRSRRRHFHRCCERLHRRHRRKSEKNQTRKRKGNPARCARFPLHHQTRNLRSYFCGPSLRARRKNHGTTRAIPHPRKALQLFTGKWHSNSRNARPFSTSRNSALESDKREDLRLDPCQLSPSCLIFASTPCHVLSSC